MTESVQLKGACAFSQLVERLRLDVEVYHNAKVCGRWQINEHELGSTCFHMATLGGCRLEVPGHLICELAEGDIVIFPSELPHSMMPLKGDVPKLHGEQRHLDFSTAAAETGTGMLCGSVKFSHGASQMLLDALPSVFILRAEKIIEDSDWAKSLLQMILAESLAPRLGARVLLNRLSELLFIFALRQFIHGQPEQVGVLALYQQPQLARVLARVQQQPDKAWTLQTMADLAAMSRSKFAEQFRTVSGWTAMQYLTWWRMQLAWSELQAGAAVAETAECVGYQSEAAFSKAFKAQFGLRPGAARKK